MDILRTMVRVTMMRGAQSGGTVTYVPSNGGKRGSTGIRSRVVNGKRTNLSHLVANKVIPLSLVPFLVLLFVVRTTPAVHFCKHVRLSHFTEFVHVLGSARVVREDV